MRWQKTLRWAIAAFVVIFAAVVAVSFRRGPAKGPEGAAVKKLDPKVVSVGGSGQNQTMDAGNIARLIKFGHIESYEDGRQKLSEGVRFEIPNKNGRTIVLEGRQADVMIPPGKTISKGDISGGAKLTTSDGLAVQSATASWEDATQLTTMPGPVTFSKGRMKGSGVGATYDQT